MLVMGVRKVSVRMTQPHMSMPMGMTGTGQHGWLVVVRMMFVVRMLVLVFHLGVQMRVLVPFRQMQP